MSNGKKLLILNKQQIAGKVDRIAYQLYEDNFEEKELILAGVVHRGFELAKRLKTVIEQISSIRVTLIELNVDKESSVLQSSMNVDISICTNKTVVVVDDVLNSGRTLAYAVATFANIPLKKLRTVVLINRNHTLFPVAADFTGLSLATVLEEHVSVEFGEDAVFLS